VVWGRHHPLIRQGITKMKENMASLIDVESHPHVHLYTTREFRSNDLFVM